MTEQSRRSAVVGEEFREARQRARRIMTGQKFSYKQQVSQRQRVRSRVMDIREADIQRRLKSTPVENLRKYASGLRLSALRRFGITDVERLLCADPRRLHQLPGLGPTSVSALLGAARRLRKEIAEQYRFRLDPDARTSVDTALLGDVHDLLQFEERYERFDRAKRRLPAAARYLANPFGTPLVVIARLLPRRWGERIQRGARDLTLWSTSEDAVEALGKGLAVAPMPSTEEFWAMFEADAASFYAVLERIDALPEIQGTDRGRDQPEGVLEPPIGSTDSTSWRTKNELAEPTWGDPRAGHLPQELATKVEAVKLDSAGLAVSLRGYQAFGAQYVLLQKRVLLGDEMGLGKTIMALAVATHLAREQPGRCLVVGPNNVLSNWAHEIEKRTHLPGYVFHGQSRFAEFLLWRERGGIGVTTFDTLRTLPVDGRSKMHLLVVDEAHFIKNPDTRRTSSVVKILSEAEHVLFMSGTPMENTLSEFQTLCLMLQPELRLNLPRRGSAAYSRAFRQAAAPVYLRRNQVDVLHELPERIDVDEWVRFTDDDHVRYRSMLREHRSFISLRHVAYPKEGDGGKSAKLERLAELVQAAADDGRKVAIYSEFIHVLEAAIRVSSDQLGLRVFGPIRGGVPPAERMRIVNDLTQHKGPAVLVAQIRAGGVGLNIQAATVVILCEPAIKPSTEEQAIARSYRLGQTRSVRVHRLLSAEGIDPVVQQMLKRKTEEFDEYVRPSALSSASEAARDSAVLSTLRKFAEAEAERLHAHPE